MFKKFFANKRKPYEPEPPKAKPAGYSEWMYEPRSRESYAEDAFVKMLVSAKQ